MDYSAANSDLWNVIIQIGVISIMVLICNVLRLKVPFVKKSLMPTAVLAGFLLLGIKYSGLVPVNVDFLEKLTYHCLGIGFIALSLRVSKSSDTNRSTFGTALKSGAVIVSSYTIQGIIGLLITDRKSVV